MTMNRTSELFAALSKAQANFPTIPRDKTVEVTMKSGGKYKFAYAPLDTIISAVRNPLTENGLSFVQTIINEMVVTVINHSSGVSLRLAPTKIICNEHGPQAYGSALTYARRYSLTLALGIVADEDDDANTAAGNTTKPAQKKPEMKSVSEAQDHLYKEVMDYATKHDLNPDDVLYEVSYYKTDKGGEGWLKGEDLKKPNNNEKYQKWVGSALGKLRAKDKEKENAVS